MDYILAVSIIIIICVVAYESIFGYFFNIRARGCPTCESFNAHPLYDTAKAARLMDSVNNKILRLIKHLEKKYPLSEKTEMLKKNYNSSNIYEISPKNITGQTSFLRNKEVLVLCLRRQDNGELHDENIVMYVVLHELAHMSNPDWGHKKIFWDNFHFLLREAADIGIYTPENYSKKPVKYCGLSIEYSPLFD